MRHGVDANYQVGPSMEFPLGTPIMQVTGVGSSAAQALRSAELVGRELSIEMNKLGAAQGTDPRYFIKVQPLTPPGPAEQQLSSKLRTLLAVLAFGAITVFVVVSVMTALEERRTRETALPDNSPDDSWPSPPTPAANGHTQRPVPPIDTPPQPTKATTGKDGSPGSEWRSRSGVY